MTSIKNTTSFMILQFYLIIVTFSFLTSPLYAANINTRDISTVTAAIPANFPPYYQLDKQGKPVGFAIDIMNSVARRSGFQVEYRVEDSWGKIFSAVKKGEVNLIPNVGATIDRETFLDFTLPVEIFHISIFVRADSHYNFINKTQLKGHKVGAIKNNEGRKIVSKIEGVALTTFDSFEQALFALQAGHIDALVYPEPVAWKLALEVKQERQIKVSGQPLAEIKRVIGIRKGDKKLLTLLNTNIKQFIKSEEYRKIYIKWFSSKPSFWTKEIILWFFGVLFFIVISMFIIFRYNHISKLNKELDKRVTQRTNKLTESETRHRSLIENMVDGFITIDDKGCIQTLNHAAEKLFGYEEREVVGENIKIFMPKPHKSEYEDYLSHYRNTGIKKTISIEREIDGLKKDGTTFPIDLSVAEIILEEKKLFSGIVRDITERKKAEKDLIDAKNEAEKSNKAKSDFLSSMSHELRTPMNAVLGFAQLLELDNATFNENQVKSVQEILQAGGHLLHLINEVLDLAKIESGKLDIALQEISLQEVIKQCKGIIDQLAIESNIQIDYGDPSGYTVVADSIRLKQVLLNYISNAVKYNRPNGHVKINYQIVEDNRLRVNVIDTGYGLNEEQLSQLFQPFGRVGAKSSTVEGAGIGLVISKYLLELMNGTVGVSSKVGEGSNFWFEIDQVNTL